MARKQPDTTSTAQDGLLLPALDEVYPIPVELSQISTGYKKLMEARRKFEQAYTNVGVRFSTLTGEVDKLQVQITFLEGMCAGHESRIKIITFMKTTR